MTAAPDAQTQGESRWQRIQAPTLLAGGVLGASVLLHLRDPHESGSWGFCPWLVLTGTSCPGCGGLRAVNDLTRGDLGAAASSNLLFVGALPLLLFGWGRWFSDRWNDRRRHANNRTVRIYAGLALVVTIVFWVVRNLEFGAWLAP
jgi:hypothetical protein